MATAQIGLWFRTAVRGVQRFAVGVGLLAGVVGVAHAADGSLEPVVTPAKAGTECVAPPAVMRRDHMEMLKHQRDETVHGGIRGAQASLKACVNCHASPETNSVAKAPTDFCVSCHSFAAVKNDCFECHATKPEGQASAFHMPIGPIHASALAHRMRQSVRAGTPVNTPSAGQGSAVAGAAQ